MNYSTLKEFQLIGIALPSKTTNQNGQSSIDCGNLWQKFEKENYAKKIQGKISEEILAVYHNYEGDYSQPFSYFIGCRVEKGTVPPDGMASLKIPDGRYIKYIAKGIMPGCITDSWKKIGQSGLQRAYHSDFEVYDDRSTDWNNAEVDIFISIK